MFYCDVTQVHYRAIIIIMIVELGRLTCTSLQGLNFIVLQENYQCSWATDRLVNFCTET